MIYHLCPTIEWERRGSTLTPDSLETEGFIHCSYLDQLVGVASSQYHGAEDLVVLTIDPYGLSLVVEDCHEAGETYPHVYGPLPVSSVKAVTPFPPSPDGTFQLPAGLAPAAPGG